MDSPIYMSTNGVLVFHSPSYHRYLSLLFLRTVLVRIERYYLNVVGIWVFCKRRAGNWDDIMKSILFWILYWHFHILYATLLFTLLNCPLFTLFFREFYYRFLIKFFIVIQLELSAFPPHPSTPHQTNPPPPPFQAPLNFLHVSSIVVPLITSPQCPFPIWIFYHSSIWPVV